MKKKHIVVGIALASLGLVLPACGSRELDNYPWNAPREKHQGQNKEIDDTGGAGAEDPVALAKEMKGGMNHVITCQEHNYQYQRANHIDVYAGYWTVTQNKFLFGGALPTTYTFPNDYLMGAMSTPSALYPAIRNAYFHGERLGVPHFKAIAMILFDFTAQELTDIFGPLAFDDMRAVKRFPPRTYISQQEVYKRIFDELDEASKILRETQPSSDELAKIEGPRGGISRGDWRNWVKFANSIRLRMAMNIVKVDPTQARQQAEKAMSDDIGVFTDKDAYDFTQDRNFCDWVGDNPIWKISVGWDDLRLGGSMENIMKRLDNPLIGVWFTKHGNILNANNQSTGYTFEDEGYIGVRQGIPMINKSDKLHGYGPYSAASSNMQNMPLPWIKRTEMLFIMAEAALRGWNTPGGATAQEWYERGIKLSFTENGLTEDDAAKYMERTEPKDIDYVDPYAGKAHDLKGRVMVGVAWNETDTDEIKLEKIITQKYMAVFPCSAPTWTTFRRTGYPRLFPVYINNWRGVDGELQLRRIPYVENPNNAEELKTLPALLGGPNEGSTRLWWDVPTETITDIPGDDLAKSKRREPKNF